MKKKFYLLRLLGLIAFLFVSYPVLALQEIQSEGEFNQIIQQHQNVIVDFYASWCAPCQRMMAVLSGVEKEISNVTFIKVNIDFSQELVNSYKILNIPTLIFLKDGKKIERTGPLTKSELKEKIQKLFA